MDRVEELLVGLALGLLLFPSVAAQECWTLVLRPGLTAGEAGSWTETRTDGEPAWWRRSPQASVRASPS